MRVPAETLLQIFNITIYFLVYNHNGIAIIRKSAKITADKTRPKTMLEHSGFVHVAVTGFTLFDVAEDINISDELCWAVWLTLELFGLVLRLCAKEMFRWQDIQVHEDKITLLDGTWSNQGRHLNSFRVSYLFCFSCSWVWHFLTRRLDSLLVLFGSSMRRIAQPVYLSELSHISICFMLMSCLRRLLAAIKGNSPTTLWPYFFISDFGFYDTQSEWLCGWQ